MDITVEYRSPTKDYCHVAIFINGELTGILKLHQRDIGGFDQIIAHGCMKGIDKFLGLGKSTIED